VIELAAAFLWFAWSPEIEAQTPEDRRWWGWRYRELIEGK
jgi:hypothetical protein